MRKLNLLAHASATRKQGRLIGALIDVTPEFVVAETRSLMLQEMNHRVRNLFAVIASLVSIGARSHSDIKSFATDVRDRIISLGRAHSLSSQGGLQSPISLIELLDTMLLSYRERTKIDLQGRNIQIPEEILTPLAMILYEWATNAAKHGVLGPREGTLQIHWFIDTTGIAIHWKEVGKDLALVPTSAGFGTQLVASSAQQIKGSITCETDAETYHLTLTFPLSVRKN
ncbi:sensor histidine kinase [Asaia astilbis]|uniref:sensor histidine kinase n=1 Tax=Asaia astilbis TaxID=610244 RepID=UPI000ACA4B59|nr:sensor histidine kinase [Asaia astilbis]